MNPEKNTFKYIINRISCNHQKATEMAQDIAALDLDQIEKCVAAIKYGVYKSEHINDRLRVHRGKPLYDAPLHSFVFGPEWDAVRSRGIELPAQILPHRFAGAAADDATQALVDDFAVKNWYRLAE